MNKYPKLLLITLFSLTLCACGFSLRGKEILPPQMRTMYLLSSSPYGKLELALRKSLIASGATIVATDDAPVILQITTSNFAHDNPNLVSTTQATIYNFTYNTSFAILDRKENIIVPQQSVTVTRTVTLNPNEVLDASNEIDRIQQEMLRDVIFEIQNRLNSNNTRNALNKAFNHETTSRSVNKSAKK